MDVQKLEKLNELREKGIISQEEFDAQKQEIILETSEEQLKPKKSTGSIIFQTIGYLLLLCIAVSFLADRQLPDCNNKQILKKDLLGAVENIPALRFLGIKPILVENAVEKSYDKTKEIRKCDARVHLSNGVGVDVFYTLSRHGDQYLIEAGIKE